VHERMVGDGKYSRRKGVGHDALGLGMP